MTIAGGKATSSRQFNSARDFETSSSQIGEFEPVSQELRTKAQRIVCSNAVGETLAEQVADATDLLMALGIHPDQPVVIDTVSAIPSPSYQLRQKMSERK